MNPEQKNYTNSFQENLRIEIKKFISDKIQLLTELDGNPPTLLFMTVMPKQRYTVHTINNTEDGILFAECVLDKINGHYNRMLSPRYGKSEFDKLISYNAIETYASDLKAPVPAHSHSVLIVRAKYKTKFYSSLTEEITENETGKIYRQLNTRNFKHFSDFTDSIRIDEVYDLEGLITYITKTFKSKQQEYHDKRQLFPAPNKQFYENKESKIWDDLIRKYQISELCHSTTAERHRNARSKSRHKDMWNRIELKRTTQNLSAQRPDDAQ